MCIVNSFYEKNLKKFFFHQSPKIQIQIGFLPHFCRTFSAFLPFAAPLPQPFCTQMHLKSTLKKDAKKAGLS